MTILFDLNKSTSSIIILVIFAGNIQVESCSTTSEFPCNDGIECIDLTRKCDDTPDCTDLSDEENCTTSQNCPEGAILCPDLSCENSLDDCPDISTATTEQGSSVSSFNQTESTTHTQGCEAGCIAGIVIGVIVFIVVVTILIYFIYIRQKKDRKARVEPDIQPEPVNESVKNPMKEPVKDSFNKPVNEFYNAQNIKTEIKKKAVLPPMEKEENGSIVRQDLKLPFGKPLLPSIGNDT